MTAPDAVAVLVATQNLNAVLRVMQWGVIVLIFLFFLRVIRAVWVEMSPATIRKSRSERRQERAPGARGGPTTRPPRRRAAAASSTSRWSQPPAHAGRTYDLDDELTIGRSPGCGVSMPEDIYTSTLHARLFRRDDQLWVEDLGSTNGTFVNSRADHPGGAPRQGRPAPDRLHRVRGLAVTVLRSGSATDVGRVRTVNQDLPLERPNLYAVADGMGGHVGGEVAARVAVETLEHAFERAPTVAGLREAFSEANAAVWHESQANADLRGMGTTLTAMALVGGAGRPGRARPGQRRGLAGLRVLRRATWSRSPTTTAWPRSGCATAR